MVQCRSRARLVSACPNPAVALPDAPLVYGGKRIVPEEVVERCQTHWEEAGDEDVLLQMMPVTDAASGHHFANVFCLLCHGGKPEDALPWAQTFVWNWKSLRFIKYPTDLTQALKVARDLHVKTVALPPRDIAARRCLPRDYEAFYRLCDCPDIGEMCDAGQDSYIYGGR
nr:hypothetical protein BaRGS_010012 [Batillaria attramentaria]